MAPAEEGVGCRGDCTGDCVVGNQTHQQHIPLQPSLPLLSVSVFRSGLLFSTCVCACSSYYYIVPTFTKFDVRLLCDYCVWYEKKLEKAFVIPVGVVHVCKACTV